MNTKSKILLLSCCAPCSADTILQLKSDNANFAVLFYNPNIFPEMEYEKRLNEQIKFCEKYNVKYFVGEYDHNEWLCSVLRYAKEPERGKRCSECFKYRFKYGIRFARENGFNKIASVFGVSKHKSQEQVDAAFNNASSEFKVQSSELIYLHIFATQHSELSTLNPFYRQKYCGCEFSNHE